MTEGVSTGSTRAENAGAGVASPDIASGAAFPVQRVAVAEGLARALDALAAAHADAPPLEAVQRGGEYAAGYRDGLAAAHAEVAALVEDRGRLADRALARPDNA